MSKIYLERNHQGSQGFSTNETLSNSNRVWTRVTSLLVYHTSTFHSRKTQAVFVCCVIQKAALFSQLLILDSIHSICVNCHVILLHDKFSRTITARR